MDAAELVATLKVIADKAAVKRTLEAFRRPLGRQPDPSFVRLSECFLGLEPEDQDRVAEAIDQAVGQALDNDLLVLDGLLALEPPGGK